jgi:hypothetical protein
MFEDEPIPVEFRCTGCGKRLEPILTCHDCGAGFCSETCLIRHRKHISAGPRKSDPPPKRRSPLASCALVSGVLVLSIFCCLGSCVITGGLLPKSKGIDRNGTKFANKDNHDANEKKQSENDESIAFVAKHGEPDGVETNEDAKLSSDETVKALIYDEAKIAVVFVPRNENQRQPPFTHWVLDCYRDTETNEVVDSAAAVNRLDTHKKSVVQQPLAKSNAKTKDDRPAYVPGQKLSKDTFEHFSKLYGPPDRTRTTEKDIPKTLVVSKLMIYEPENVKIVLRATSDNDSKKPVSEWKWSLSGFATLEGKLLSAKQATAALEPRCLYRTGPTEFVTKVNPPPMTGTNSKTGPPTVNIPTYLPGSSFAGNPATVNVRGYTRKDGTYVAPYTRRAPRR